ncbi:hypothetical protein LEP1GSC137_3035 [Leptospira borgpetersenii str. Noumea 25]|uniref:Uncharacterized protein n=1 Tax=Leptospira borgpetersenii serovar Ballum TaxID=280505 RepID=A0A0S2ILD8_LEPBO|nr:hypothetical protein LBBP_00100 [Leptospira borgpetersenii serovar Ballum]EKR01634.1 hypothetical protein LEP1GSC121_0367 [Leptospira borgpetersenii serovar Castellonis str. 200801910]EMO08796.1 hypothetical protein LEP1GSC137_3035 [Leptospira borgpetersenii str. Noumea 25]
MKFANDSPKLSYIKLTLPKVLVISSPHCKKYSRYYDPK